MRGLLRKGRRLSLLALLGAYFFDSRQGARRRARAKDVASRTTSTARRRLETRRRAAGVS
jgi:hypothetical protein